MVRLDLFKYQANCDLPICCIDLSLTAAQNSVFSSGINQAAVSQLSGSQPIIELL